MPVVSSFSERPKGNAWSWKSCEKCHKNMRSAWRIKGKPYCWHCYVSLLGEIKQNGYIHVKNEGWEHRRVVENYIGRLLREEEVVHHLDEDKTNNDIDNLMVFPTQKEHAKWHNQVKRTGLTHPMKKKIEERWNGL